MCPINHMVADLTTLVKCMFRNKRDYAHLEDEDKVKLFFKFNRYAARRYANNAHFFNRKGIDRAAAMDQWFDFFRDVLYTPDWFYPKNTKKVEPVIDGLDERDVAILTYGFKNELESYMIHCVELKEPITTIKKKKKKDG